MFQPDISTGGNRLNRYTLWDISSDLEYIYEWCFKKYSTQNDINKRQPLFNENIC